MNKLKYLLPILVLLFINTGCIGVNQEFKNIRSQILDNLEDDFDKQFEFSVGPVGFFVAGQFVKFADTKENADEILSKVKKNIHIGIYNRLSTFSKPSLLLLKTISYLLINEEWKSLVKSINGDDMIGIFVKDGNPEDIEELFIITLTDEELILLKLHGSLGSIIEIIIRDQGRSLKGADHS